MSIHRSIITSRQNPRVQLLARLRERDGRNENSLFLVEGLRELTRGLARRGERFREIYFCESLFKDTAAAWNFLETAQQRTLPLFELSADAFRKVSGREGADGLLGVAAMWDVSVGTLELPDNPLLLVVEALEKPGNLGALFRTADSVGCAALLCCDPVADIFNPNVVRASQGAVFSVPCVVADSPAIAAFLAQRGVTVFAAAPAAKKCYWDADFRGASAILLGSEKDGLSPFWIEGGAAEAVSIPQVGLSDSLNVGVAGAVCLFEALRQRKINLSLPA
jgi:TrmH family RNA methyltransferase